MFLLINLGVGFAALNTGNNLLYLVLSLLLAFLTLSGILSESALRGLEVRRTLPRELFAGGDNPVRIEIRNAQNRVPAFAIVVEDRSAPPSDIEDPATGDWRLTKDRDIPVVGRVFALRIGPKQTESRSYALRPERRGRLRFHSVRVSTRFPFGLFLKSRTLHAPGEALVYPQIEVVNAPPPTSGEQAQSEAKARSRNGGDDVSGLREWEIGDGLHRVHWKSSLRRDRLIVRTREADRQAEVEVRLRTTGAMSPDAFESRVCWAASEVVAHLASGLCVGLLTDREHLPAAAGAPQRTRLLSFLACVESHGASARQAPPEPARESLEANLG